MTVPLALLNQVPAARSEWLVPGLLKEKVRALAKSIPQRLRHKLGSLDEFAEAFRKAAVPLHNDASAGAAASGHADVEDVGGVGGTLAGTIAKASYLGTHMEYSIDTAAGVLFATCPKVERPLAMGDKVALLLAPRGVIVVES
jgi:hypothetical protein